jgi:hypothetical protein
LSWDLDVLLAAVAANPRWSAAYSEENPLSRKILRVTPSPSDNS